MSEKETGKKTGFAVAALVLGILSLLFGWIPFLGWTFIILALVFGVLGIKSKGMAIAGIVLASIGLILAVPVGVVAIKSLVNATQPVTEETTEAGGTLAEWKERLAKEAGSEEAKTLQECSAALEQLAETCSAHQAENEGWRVVNSIEITDPALQQYNFSEIKQAGCPDYSPDGEAYDYPHTVETKTQVSQRERAGSSYVVGCNLICTWWECPVEDDGQIIEPPQSETWSGTITAALEDVQYACKNAEVALDYTITLNSPVSVVAALQGEQEITLWSDPSYEDTSGSIAGTAEIIVQPPRESVIYCELEGGSSAAVPLRFYATGDEQTIQLSEVPGASSLRTPYFGYERIYHAEAGLTDESFLAGVPPLLVATSITETEISGDIKPGYGYTGTFVLRKE
ncbi:hypothetical protein HYS49_03795 [Candidatus Woesearchaeota archaeon]|nr:hypothetical protein [Candidatus Woesearchaeota archaeon]